MKSSALLSASSAMASMTADLLGDPRLPFSGFGPSQMMASALEVFAHAAAPRGKPAFGIRTIHVDGTTHAVRESTEIHRPFGDLKKFTHEGLPPDAPRLLIVAPMSGHYATLLRGTVERMLERCVVYITDWADATCRWPKGASTWTITSTIWSASSNTSAPART
jgi:poly(3-hydroxybutyrate) depolymerase